MLIAISAAAFKSGKDTVADMINKHSQNNQFERLQFAGELKKMVSGLIGCTIEDLEKQEFKASTLGPEWDYFIEELVPTSEGLYPRLVRKSRTVRDLLITIGDGLRNLVSPKVWVNSARSKYLNRKDGVGMILTDWRYPEGEGEFLSEQKALTIRVIRPDQPLIQHPSERSLDNYSFHEVIINDGTLEELEEKIKQIVIKHNL